MANAIGLLFFGAILITIIINGAFMLFDPQAWLRLPDWFAPASASFRERIAGDKSLIGVRMTGGMLLAGIVWAVYDFVSR